MSSQAIDHNLGVALHAIGFIGQMVVDEENQRFRFDQGVRNLFPKLVQVTPGEARLTELDKRIDPTDLGLIHDILQKPISKSRRLIFEYSVTDDSGRRRVLQSHNRVTRVDDAGRGSKFLTVLIDVTALRSDGEGVLFGPELEGAAHATGLVDDLMVTGNRARDASPDRASEGGPTSSAGDLLTMQDVAEHLQLPCRTLRFLEDRGLVRPQHAGEDRLFTRAQLDQLRFSARMRRIGFTITEIRNMLDDNKDRAHPRVDPKSAQAQRKLLAQQIDSLREAARMLDAETGLPTR